MASSQFPLPFKDLLASYKQLRQRLPSQAAIIAAGHFKDNFRRQGILDNGTVIAWQPRKLKRYRQRGQTGKNSSRLKLTAAGKDDRRRALLIESGRLRRAIQPSSDGDYAVVKNDTPYATAHNEGTDTLPARPFMVTTPDLENDLEEHFFNEIDKLWR
jgi:phage gpG-like protein